MPTSLIRSMVVGSARIVATSVFNRLTTGCGKPAGATSPCHEVNCVAGGNAHQRIAVSRHAGDLPGRDPAAGARPRVDDDLLTEPAGQPVGDDARDDVARPTRREAVDEGDGAIGPSALRPNRRGGAGGEAGKRGAA